MARPRKKKGGSSVKVNFKGVKSFSAVKPGDYLLDVAEAEIVQSQSGNDMIKWTFEIAAGKNKGQKVYYNSVLTEAALWNLHALLTAMGEEVPDDELDLDLSEMIGNQVVGVIDNETYEGKKKNVITDFDSPANFEAPDEDEDDDDEDDKPKKGKKSKAAEKKSKKSKKDEDDDDDDSDDSDDDEDDEPKKGKRGKKAAPAKKGKKSDDDDDSDDDDEPKKKGKSKKSDDDDDKPAKGKKNKKSKKPAKIDKSDVEDMDEDELQALIDEHDLDVDLEGIKKIGKKRAAVIEALDDEDLLEDDDD